MGINRDNIGVVLNRSEEGIGCSEDEVRRNLAEWNYLGAVPESKEWKYANNAGEIVATKNYQEINGAFAQILAGATGEHWLVEDGIPETIQEKKGGFMSRFRGKN